MTPLRRAANADFWLGLVFPLVMMAVAGVVMANPDGSWTSVSIAFAGDD